jgi:hypothetical protein
MLRVRYVPMTRPSIFITDKPIHSSDRELHKGYDHKGSVEKISGREPQGSWREDELTGHKPPVVETLTLTLTESMESNSVSG